MRIITFILLSIILVLAAIFMVPAADARADDPATGKELGLPDQPVQEGTRDFLLELRGTYPGSYLLVQTHFPQGLDVALDKVITAKAAELHADAYKEALEMLEGDVLSETMTQASAALHSGTPMPEDITKQDWSRSYISAATYELSHPSDRYASILYKIYWYSGGAHPNWVYKAWTYDRKSGKALTLEDIFPGKDDVTAALAALIQKALADKLPEVNSDDLSPTIERVCMTREGLRVVYAPYEIASFAQGDFFVDLPLKELLPLGVNAAMWEGK